MKFIFHQRLQNDSENVNGVFMHGVASAHFPFLSLSEFLSHDSMGGFKFVAVWTYGRMDGTTIPHSMQHRVQFSLACKKGSDLQRVKQHQKTPKKKKSFAKSQKVVKTFERVKEREKDLGPKRWTQADP